MNNLQLKLINQLDDWICLVVSKAGFHGGFEIFQVTFCGTVERLCPVSLELWNGDGGQDADDRNNDHQLHQGKALVVFFHLHQTFHHECSPPQGAVNGCFVLDSLSSTVTWHLSSFFKKHANITRASPNPSVSRQHRAFRAHATKKGSSPRETGSIAVTQNVTRKKNVTRELWKVAQKYSSPNSGNG